MFFIICGSPVLIAALWLLYVLLLNLAKVDRAVGRLIERDDWIGEVYRWTSGYYAQRGR